MNSVNITGRICKDLEVKGSLKFTVAVKRDYKNKDGQYESDFINCVAFGKNAENIAKFFSKGSAIELRGSILTGSYEAQDGSRRYTTEIKVDGFGFPVGGNGNAGENSGTAPIQSDDDFDTPVDDGSLPF